MPSFVVDFVSPVLPVKHTWDCLMHIIVTASAPLNSEPALNKKQLSIVFFLLFFFFAVRFSTVCVCGSLSLCYVSSRNTVKIIQLGSRFWTDRVTGDSGVWRNSAFVAELSTNIRKRNRQSIVFGIDVLIEAHSSSYSSSIISSHSNQRRRKQ